MEAQLLFEDRLAYPDGAILEMRIWRLPQCDGQRPHGLKYSLFYGREGGRIVDYDNERGKSDHRHYRERQEPYLTSTARSDGGADFTRAVDSLRRLRGTTLETNIETGETVQLDGFGLLEDYPFTTTEPMVADFFERRATRKEQGMTKLTVHVGDAQNMGRRFAAAWREAQAGRDVDERHVTFLSLEAMMAALSPKRLQLLRHLRHHRAASIKARLQARA